MDTRVGISLGSNLGDRLENLRAARELLRVVAVDGAAMLQAAVYRSEPVDCPEGSPDFFNSVLEIAYAGEPYDLLAETQGIEMKLGRARHYERNSPRVIDIDILYFGDRVMDEDRLTLPHPRTSQRRFVLQPLNDIRPEKILLGEMLTVSAKLCNLESSEPPLILVSTEW